MRIILLLCCYTLIERSYSFVQSPSSPRAVILTQRFTATAENPSVDTNAADDEDPSPESSSSYEHTNNNNQQTYYEILGARPTATRTELKRQYVTLARLTHPDANIGNNNDKIVDRSAEFSQIAQAWKVLSDDKERRRYDRSLQAEDFKRNVEVVAEDLANAAVPRVKKVFDDFAVPFFRRTTVTTVATVSAAVDMFAEGKGGRSAFSSAVKAGEAASRVVDGIEYLEKSSELDQLAAEEKKTADSIKAKLVDVVERRLHKSLSTPNAALSSSEACMLLDGLNKVEGPNISKPGRLLKLRKNAQRDIDELEETESVYYQKVAERTLAVDEFRTTQVALKQAAREAKAAVQQELAARKVLEEAEKRVTETNRNVSELTRRFTKIQALEGKITKEVEAIATTMSKRQETVRKALLKKEYEVQLALRQQAGEPVDDLDPPEDNNNVDDENENNVLDELEALRKEEKYLAAEYARCSEKVDKLVERSDKMKGLAHAADVVPPPVEQQVEEHTPTQFVDKAMAGLSSKAHTTTTHQEPEPLMDQATEVVVDDDVRIITETMEREDPPKTTTQAVDRESRGFAPTHWQNKRKKK